MLCSKRSAKILSTLTVLAGLLVSVALTGCLDPNKGKENEVLPESQTYTKNGNKLSVEEWKNFVEEKFSALDKVKYGATSTYGSEELFFEITNDKLLRFTYQSTFGNYTGEIIGYDNSVANADNRFILLLKTENHTNYTKGSCYGAPESLDDRNEHVCYLPICFAIKENALVNGAYYSNPVSCFYTYSDALENMEYDSTIYGSVPTYNRITE